MIDAKQARDLASNKLYNIKEESTKHLQVILNRIDEEVKYNAERGKLQVTIAVPEMSDLKIYSYTRINIGSLLIDELTKLGYEYKIESKDICYLELYWDKQL